MSLESGQVLSHYRMDRQIGAGGMGEVWKARDTTLGRDVAIKVLPEAFSDDPERVARFEQEATVLASLNHPNIATIHGLEQAGDMRLLIMELVPGQTLADILKERTLSVEEALPLLRQIASALGIAHASGIIHRDLKPANIQITPAGQVKVLDFGLAKAVVSTPTHSAMPTQIQTQTGVVVGTVTYLSPEQLQGRPLDPRSDMFQLGMVFFQVMTGEHPFAGETSVDVHHAILREQPQWKHTVGKVTDDLIRVIAKLLEKDPEYRYPDAAALEVDLRTLERDVSSGTSAVSLTHLDRSQRRIGRVAKMIVTTGLVAAVGGSLWLFFHFYRAADQTSPIPTTLRPLTEAVGDKSHPAFSPDGRSVVFASDRDGDWDLWVTLVSGGDPVQITNTPEDESHPAWSPDGTRVAFARYRQDRSAQDIFVMPALGGVARKVIEVGEQPSWSPDGQWLVYGSRADRGWIGIDKLAIDEGTEPVPITAREVGFFHRNPTWSPDGKWIVFTRSAGGPTGRLMRVSSAGGTPTPLLDEPQGIESFYPTFSADGRYVIHSSDRGGTLNLWRIPFDGGSAERITSGPGPDWSAGVSPDGRRIAFVNRRTDPQVLAISPADGTTKLLAEFEGGTGWFPVVSPDRRWIAFSRKPPSGSWSIFVMPREGGPARRLIEGSLSTQWPRFHPDGLSLLFFTWPGSQRIGRVNLDGTGLSWLTAEDVDASYQDVSPDGTWLAYVRRRPGTDGGEYIVVRDFDGGPERVVVPNATLPEISPDGRMICFAGARAFTSGVGVVELPDGEPRWLTDSGTWPTWMPDGRAIAYADEPSGGEQQAWMVPLDGGEPRRLGNVAWFEHHMPFDVDPGTGELITTDQTEVKSTIWLAEYD